jgi:hypothetical protein
VRLSRRLRRLRTRAYLLWDVFEPQIIMVIAVTGVTTMFFQDFARDDTTIPFLTGLAQVGVAAVLFWRRLQRA